MTKFELPSFGTPANSKAYRDNFDNVFGKKDKKKKPQKDEDPKGADVHSEVIDVEEKEED
jgi:hypothetical protein